MSVPLCALLAHVSPAYRLPRVTAAHPFSGSRIACIRSGSLSQRRRCIARLCRVPIPCPMSAGRPRVTVELLPVGVGKGSRYLSAGSRGLGYRDAARRTGRARLGVRHGSCQAVLLSAGGLGGPTSRTLGPSRPPVHSRRHTGEKDDNEPRPGALAGFQKPHSVIQYPRSGSAHWQVSRNCILCDNIRVHGSAHWQVSRNSRSICTANTVSYRIQVTLGRYQEPHQHHVVVRYTRWSGTVL